MKRLFAVVAAMLLAVSAFAQFEPTTTWPYIYKDFSAGELQMPDGSVKKALYNIHLGKAKLHFIEGELIREVNSSDVFAVRIGEDVYANAQGMILKVLSKSEKAFIAERMEIDDVRLNSTEGAYGSSASTLATRGLSSLEGIGGTRTNMNHMELRNSRDDGKILPLNRKVYLVYGTVAVPATQKDVLDIPEIDKNAVKAFVKENKIKWKDPVSLQILADFLAK